MKKLISIFIIFSFAVILVSGETVSANQTIIKTPQEAAKGLFSAWKKKDRKTAEKFARAEAINKLFGVRRQIMTFKGCTKSEEGDYECIYKANKLDLSLAMIVKNFRGGYKVVSLSFSSEAEFSLE